MSLSGTDDQKIIELCKKTYKDQGVWFLNGFWKATSDDDHEKVWDYVHHFQKLDEEKGADGCCIDELKAHIFLEQNKATQTVMEMRTNLREVGAIPKTGRPKDFPLTHFLISHFKVDWHQLVNAAQGDNQEEVLAAQKMLEAVQTALDEVLRSAKEASEKEAEARKAEAAAKAAQAELEAALAEVKKQEDAYNNKTKELEAKSEAGGVSGMRAKNELAQHLSEDPLPLRKAKITAEAAVKKAERTTKAATEATSRAIAAREAAEAAVVEMQNKVAEAEAYLHEVKSKPGSAEGALWWIERGLTEKKKYMPLSKGGILRK